jgi:hypothetical protein
MKKATRFLLAFLIILLLGEAVDLAWLGYVRATVTSAQSSVVIGGNGSITNFTFPFIGVASNDITVIYTDANGNQTTLTPNTQYTLTLTAPLPGAIWGLGGSVTYPLVGSPIASGTTITIARTLPYLQTVSSNQGQAFPTAVEAALDLLSMQIQQVDALFGRGIAIPVSDSCGSLAALPAAVQRANQALGFDSTGCIPVAISTLPAGTVSSAMQPVVNAPTIAAARTDLGLGSAATENIGSYGLADDGAGNLRQTFTTVSDSGSQSVTSAFQLNQRICTGPITYTLPRANTLWNGFGFWIYSISGICTITPNASDNFPGVASGTGIAIPAGSWVWISTNAASTGTWWLDVHGPSNGSLAAVASGNALTITYSGGPLRFRDTTLANGDPLWAIPQGALGITIPQGATLGTSSGNVAFRIWIFAAYNGGTPILGVAKCSIATAIFPCAIWDSIQKSGAAITAGSTSAGTLYTASAISNDSVIILGYADYASGLGTAGTWLSAPTTLQFCLAPASCRKPGDTIQTVTGTTSSSTSSCGANTPTALFATITPTSAANLIRARSDWEINSGTTATFTGSVRMSRGTLPTYFGTQTPLTFSGLTGNLNLNIGGELQGLDSPNTASATNYYLYCVSGGGVFNGTAVPQFMFLDEIMGMLVPANDNAISLSLTKIG